MSGGDFLQHLPRGVSFLLTLFGSPAKINVGEGSFGKAASGVAKSSQIKDLRAAGQVRPVTSNTGLPKLGPPLALAGCLVIGQGMPIVAALAMVKFRRIYRKIRLFFTIWYRVD
jgi:hypothetical protein